MVPERRGGAIRRVSESCARTVGSRLYSAKYLTWRRQAAILPRVQQPLRPHPVRSLPERASDDLRFIRHTMERAVAFTAVPGWGGVLMGCTALGAAALAMRAGSPRAWLATWLVAAALAVLIGVSDMAQKAAAGRSSFRGSWRAPGWRFAAALCPALVAGACLTVVLARSGLHALLPGVWLLLYGAGVASAASFSIRPVRNMGLAFMLAGVLALLSPAGFGDAWMAAGFGGLQISFGLWIARHPDG